LPLLPAFGRVATTLILVALVACTDSSTPIAAPTPGPTGSASPVPPDPRARERFAVASYCIDAVRALDAKAAGDDEVFEEALAELEDDLASLPADSLRAEARDLVRFLDDPEALSKTDKTFALIEWRLHHTPEPCLDVTGVLSELAVEQRDELEAPASRATTRWYGKANNGLLTLSVLPLAVADDDCTVHTFPVAAGGERVDGVFRSGCKSWGKNNRHNFVMVELTNLSTVPPRFRLEDVMAFDRDDRLLSPVDVQSQTNEPENFLPSHGTITDSGERGFVVFDAPDLGLRAVVFHYEGDLLIVTFEGNEQTVPRSSG
jgi:hypothetical protein